MFLATTGLTDVWDTSDEILLLSRGCLRNDRRPVWRELKWKVLSDPWGDPRSIDEAAAYCERVVDEATEFLAGALNGLHGTRHSLRYWAILLRPWLTYYVHASYAHYIALKAAVESHGGLTTAVLRPTVSVTPLDTVDFARLSFIDEFNLQLCSQLLGASSVGTSMICRAVDLDLQSAVESVRRITLSSTSLRKRWRRWAAARATAAAVALFRPGALLGRIDFGPIPLARLLASLARRGRGLPCLNAVRVDRAQVDEGKRYQLAGFHGWDDFTSALGRLLSVSVPVLWVEGYEAYSRACLAMWPHRPAVVISSSDWYFNESFKFIAAEYGERGARLVGVQHGGGYGMSASLPQEKYETSVADRWLSFGWPGDEPAARVQPFMHPRFSVVKRAKPMLDLLFICTSYGRYIRRFESYHFPIGDFALSLEWRERFLRTLPPPLRDRVKVRLDGEDCGWGQADRLVQACGPLRFDDWRRPLRASLGKARLVVLEYAGTAFLETLAADVPTVAFWDVERWRLRESAVPYLRRLQDARILFGAPDEAAAWVTHIHDDADYWWGDKPTQRARRAFVERYARRGDDWLADWTTMLEEELRLAGNPVMAGRRPETAPEIR